MSMKTFIWGGMFVGSGIGSVVPLLWGASALSMSSLILSAVGGVAGIWTGYQMGKSMGL